VTRGRARTGLALAATTVVGVATLGSIAPFLALAFAPGLGAGDGVGAMPSSRIDAAWSLLGTSLAWSFGVALAAAAIGLFAAGPVAAAFRTGRGGWLPVAVTGIALVPPSYLTYSLWSATGPGTPLGEASGLAERAVVARHAALALGLLLWAVPVAILLLGAWRAARPDPQELLRRLDGIRGVPASFARVRHEAPGVALAIGAIGLGLLGETVAFDLAQVRTYGYELRALDALGVPAKTLAALAWPTLALPLAAGAAGLALVARTAPRGAPRSHAAPPSAWRGALPLVPGAVALAYLLLRIGEFASLRDFALLHGGSVVAHFGIAAATASIVAAVAVATRALALRGGAARSLAFGVALLTLAAATAPATLLALGHAAVWNRPVLGPLVYDTPAIVVVGLASRFAAVGCLAGLVAAAAEPARRRELVALDGPVGLRAALRRDRPILLALAGGTAAVTLALAFAEIPVASRLAPPGSELLSTSVLNAMHYRRPETVTAAAWLSIGLGVAAAATLVLARGAWRRAALGLVAIAILPPGCGPSDALPALPSVATIAGSGFGPGQFLGPRAAAIAPDGTFFVVDKQARVQRFGPDGAFELEWSMPESERGKPVGISVHPDGRVFVADTHYHRIVVFDRDGRELARFGRYGTGPGEFFYPTDIVFPPDGRILVSEYGGNDRVQVFSASFAPLGSFGRFGRGEREFARPQSMTIAGDELVVADGCNHRLQVYGLDGGWRRDLGGPGREPGRFAYPYGVESLGDGTALVVEFGGHRLQRIRLADGAPLGAWGGPPTEGRDAAPPPGRLLYPFGLASGTGFGQGRVAILDTGHDRVELVRVDDLAVRLPPRVARTGEP